MNGNATERPVLLITGSTGLIGTRVAKAFADRYQVVGLDIKPPDEELAGTEFIECDLTDDRSVNEALGQVGLKHGPKIASVIHLAAYYDFSGDPSPMYEELTVEGTRRLLRALQSFEAEQFVFSSTLLMMKPVSQGETLTEDSPIQAEWEYPASKVETEKVVRDEHGKVPAVIARLAGVYDEQGHSLPIGQQIKRIYEKDFESHFYPGNQDHGQSFIHLDDVVTFFERTVEKRHELGPLEVFLVGEPDVMSYGELQDAFGEQLHGEEWTTIRVPRAVAKAGAWVKEKMASDEDEVFIKPWMVDLADAHYPVDISRARSKLGWAPARSLRETVPEIARRLKQNPRQWYETNNLPLPDSLK